MYHCMYLIAADQEGGKNYNIHCQHQVTPLGFSQSQPTAPRVVLQEVPGMLFWVFSEHVEAQCSFPCTSVECHQRFERCQREARPPGAGISQPSGGSLSTTLRICQTTTPRPREELCSAPRLEVLMSRMRKERDSE